MECPRSPIYHTSIEQKRHAQNVARKQRVGKTNLRELLRDRCRARIMLARKDCVDKNRSIQAVDLSDILRLELNELDQDIEIEEQVYKELLSEMNELYALGIQDVENLYTDDADSDDTLLCPVCLLKPLQCKEQCYNCTCGVQFKHAADTIQLRQLIQDKVDEHELNCTKPLRFFIEPDTNRSGLGAICGSCDYACTI